MNERYHSCPSINAIGPAPHGGGYNTISNINVSKTMLVCIANTPSFLQKQSNGIVHNCTFIIPEITCCGCCHGYHKSPHGCMQGRRPDIADAMAIWVQQEACDKRQQWWDTSTWPRLYPRCIPHQTDSSSCGLYALVLAECLAAGFALEHCTMADTNADCVRARLLHKLSDIAARMAAPYV